MRREKRLDPLVVSYASVSGSRAPLWIAKEMGILEKHGLDGRPIYVPAGYPSVSALISGGVQFVATGGSVVAAAAARGAQVVMVATLGSIAYKLMAHPSISTIEGLRGKVIGGLRPGTTTDFVLQRILLKVRPHPRQRCHDPFHGTEPIRRETTIDVSGQDPCDHRNRR
jgi:hypothetical protein